MVIPGKTKILGKIKGWPEPSQPGCRWTGAVLWIQNIGDNNTQRKKEKIKRDICKGLLASKGTGSFRRERVCESES